jgi:hypothetical protein
MKSMLNRSGLVLSKWALGSSILIGVNEGRSLRENSKCGTWEYGSEPDENLNPLSRLMLILAWSNFGPKRGASDSWKPILFTSFHYLIVLQTVTGISDGLC